MTRRTIPIRWLWFGLLAYCLALVAAPVAAMALVDWSVRESYVIIKTEDGKEQKLPSGLRP